MADRWAWRAVAPVGAQGAADAALASGAPIQTCAVGTTITSSDITKEIGASLTGLTYRLGPRGVTGRRPIFGAYGPDLPDNIPSS